jgi:hypothetical protein
MTMRTLRVVRCVVVFEDEETGTQLEFEAQPGYLTHFDLSYEPEEPEWHEIPLGSTPGLFKKPPEVKLQLEFTFPEAVMRTHSMMSLPPG